MKHITKQSVKLFAAVLFFMLAAKVTAQNTVYEVSGVKSTNSIIRTLDPDRYVIYNDYNGVPTFGYADIINGTYTEASMSGIPQLVINDMEIVNGNVYFCGKLSYLPYVLFGFFDINSMFFGGGSISYCVLSTMTITNPPTLYGVTENIVDLLRIEPYVISGNDIHIFMVGESYHTDITGVDHYHRCIFDAHYDGSTTIDLSTFEDFDGIYYFNDIAATQTHLIIVGDKHGGTGQYMTWLPLPSASTPLFLCNIPFPTPYIPNYYWSADIDYYPVPEVRIEAFDVDAFATVCKGYVYGGIGVSIPGIVLTTYNVAINMIERNWIANPNDVIQFRDLKYSYADQHLYYVAEFPLCANPNHVYGSHILAGYAIGAHIDNEVFSMPKVCSVDTRMDDVGAFASGYSNNGILNLWHVAMSESPCTAMTPLNSTDTAYFEPSDFLEYSCNTDSPMLTSRIPTINQYKITVICKE